MDVLSSFYGLIPVTIAQSLIVSFVVLGVMLPFRILNFPDLTSEGAFPLGGCVCGTLITAGINPFLACALRWFAALQLDALRPSFTFVSRSIPCSPAFSS